VSFKIDKSLSFYLYGVRPPPKVDTKDTATAKSGITTLDRVAVSDKKMKMIYIKWGKVGPVRLGNSAESDNEREGHNGKTAEHQQCLRWPRAAPVQAHFGRGFRSLAVAQRYRWTLDHPPRWMSRTFGPGHLWVSPTWPWCRDLMARAIKEELGLNHRLVYGEKKLEPKESPWLFP
jgi:hypothetical protein